MHNAISLYIIQHCLKCLLLHTHPIYLYLTFHFWHSLIWNFEFDELDFFPSLNWIFTACVACKNPVQTLKKIRFIKLGISSLIMSKIKCRLKGGKGIVPTYFYNPIQIRGGGRGNLRPSDMKTFRQVWLYCSFSIKKSFVSEIIGHF